MKAYAVYASLLNFLATPLRIAVGWSGPIRTKFFNISRTFQKVVVDYKKPKREFFLNNDALRLDSAFLWQPTGLSIFS